MKSPLISRIRTGVAAGVAAVAILASVPSAHGQSESRVRVNVPFAFEDGNQHFRAGQYVFGLQLDQMLLIRGSADSGLLMVGTSENADNSIRGKLVFHRYGDRYFLKEVWIPGKSAHLVCPKSRAERHVDLATNETAASNVELALLTNPR